MRNTLFDIDHVGQLREIERARIKRGEPGLRQPIVALIRDLTDGGVVIGQPIAQDIRELQARKLYDLKLGDVLGCKSFDEYLDADGNDSLEPIPDVPGFPAPHFRLFGRSDSLYLVDGRIVEKIGLKEYCRLLGVVYTSEDKTFEPFDPAKAKSGVRWMIGHDGYRNRGRSVDACRKTLAPWEVGMDVVEGLAVFAQRGREILEGHFMDLGGSVYVKDRDNFAYLGIIDGKPELYWGWYYNEHPGFGLASRGE